MRLSRIHFPVTVLGPGHRLGLWLQGCSLHCAGCISRDTWAKDAGQEVPVPLLIERCRQLVASYRTEKSGQKLDGITISGGEPFEQLPALLEFLDGIAEWKQQEGFDVLCYSGLPLKRIESEYSEVLARLDALIPEPFRKDLPTEAPWRGSSNQPLVILSELGRQRYTNLPPTAPAIQFAVTDGAIWFIGTPRRGDMERLQSVAAERGLSLGDLSWN